MTIERTRSTEQRSVEPDVAAGPGTVTGRLLHHPKLRSGEQFPEEMIERPDGEPVPFDLSWCCLSVKPDDGTDLFDLFVFGPILMGVVRDLRPGDLVSAEVDGSRTRTRTFVGRLGDEVTLLRYVAISLEVIDPTRDVTGAVATEGVTTATVRKGITK